MVFFHCYVGLSEGNVEYKSQLPPFSLQCRTLGVVSPQGHGSFNRKLTWLNRKTIPDSKLVNMERSILVHVIYIYNHTNPIQLSTHGASISMNFYDSMC